MVRNVLNFLTVAALLVTMANAKNYTVGDSDNGWRLGVNYKTWTSGKSFRVGDILAFRYDATEHDVVQVSKEDYDVCSPSNPLSSDNTGAGILTLFELGTVYIICGTEGHCKQGMKIQVNIVGNSSPSYKLTSFGYFALAFSLMMMANAFFE